MTCTCRNDKTSKCVCRGRQESLPIQIHPDVVVRRLQGVAVTDSVPGCWYPKEHPKKTSLLSICDKAFVELRGLVIRDVNMWPNEATMEGAGDPMLDPRGAAELQQLCALELGHFVTATIDGGVLERNSNGSVLCVTGYSSVSINGTQFLGNRGGYMGAGVMVEGEQTHGSKSHNVDNNCKLGCKVRTCQQ